MLGGWIYLGRRRLLGSYDIKPGNILFDESAHVYVYDFGIAKALTDGQDVGAIAAAIRCDHPRLRSFGSLPDWRINRHHGRPRSRISVVTTPRKSQRLR